MFGKIGKKIKNRFLPKVNTSATIVVGNQKSGTSVIANLLADHAGLTKTIDIPPLWGYNGAAVMNGKMPLKTIINDNKRLFCSDLIKEPMMTFFVGQALEVFNKSKFVFIVRDPRDNIRSLLNSRGLPGDLDQLKNSELPDNPNHRILIDSSVWGGEGSYINILAHRWNLAITQFLENKDCLLLVRYEDFLKDKEGYIINLAKELGLEHKNNIAHKVDIQYQPKGDRNVSWNEFFGGHNLSIIEEICKKKMGIVGYEIS